MENNQKPCILMVRFPKIGEATFHLESTKKILHIESQKPKKFLLKCWSL